MHQDGNSINSIIKELNLSIGRVALSKYLRDEGYKTAKTNKLESQINYEILYKEYITEGNSTHTIAKKYNVYQNDVTRLLDKYNIPKRTNHEWRTAEEGYKIKRDGYILVKMSNHPFSTCNYIKEHRIIMEEYLLNNNPSHYALIEIEGVEGKWLDPNLVVHHKNYKRDDNRIENLQLMTKSEHSRLHTNERWQKK